MNITVAIITRNRAKSLERCLESLTKQTKKSFEILVVDNASSDETNKVVDSFQGKLPIKYLYESQIGIPYARNRALRRARGEILAFIDDDCEASRTWVERIEQAHKRNPNVAAIQGKSRHLPKNGLFAVMTRLAYDRWIKRNTFDGNKLFVLDTRNASLNLKIIKKMGLEFDPVFYRGSDVDFAMQILSEKKEIIFEPSILNYHWARTNIFSFLKQKYEHGKSEARRKVKWKAKFAPKKVHLGRHYYLQHSNLLLKAIAYLRKIAYEKGYKDQIKQNPPPSFFSGDSIVKEVKVKNKKVCVAIITMNRSSLLERCLKSLTKQASKIYQVLIVDNSSNDNTKHVAARFKNKLPIRYVLEKHIGIPFARNRALREAHGEILAFIDDDCEASPDWLENIQKFHFLYPQAIAIQGWSDSVPKNSLISILALHNRELFIKSHITDKKIQKRLWHPRSFQKALNLICFNIGAIDTKNISFKLNKLKTLRIKFDTEFIRGSDVDFGKQLNSLGQKIVLCPPIRVSHWERKSVGEFLTQRFEFARGSARSRRKWNYGTNAGIGPFRRGRAFLRYLKAAEIKLYLMPALLILFALDKTITLWGHIFQRRKFSQLQSNNKMNDSVIFRGAFWLSSSDVLQKVIHFLIIVSLIKLGPIYIGIFYLGLSLLHFLVNVLTRSLSVKFIPNLRYAIYKPEMLKNKVSPEEIVAFSLKSYAVMSLAITIMLLLTLVPLVSLFHRADITYFVFFIVLALPFAIVSSYIVIILKLFQKFKEVLFLHVVFTVIAQLGLTIFLVRFLSLGIVGAAISQLFAFTFIFLAGLFLVFPFIDPTGFSKKISLKTYKIGLLTIANFTSASLIKLLHILFILFLFGLARLGVFVVLFYLPALMHNITTASFSMFLTVGRLKNNQEELIGLSKTIMKWIVVVSIPIMVILLFYTSQILTLVFHYKYARGVQIAQIMSVAFFVQSFSWMAGRNLILAGKMKEYVLSNLLFGIIFLAAAIILAPIYELTGVALSLLISSVIDFGIKLTLCSKKAEIVFIEFNQLKIIAGGLFFAVIIYYFINSNLFIFVGLFMSLYLALIIFGGILEKNEIDKIKALISKNPLRINYKEEE